MSLWLLLKGAALAVRTFAVVNAAPLGLIATGVGAMATGIIAWRAGKRSSLVIGQAKAKKGAPLTTGEKIKATWKLWLPVCVSIILTFGGAACTYYVQSAEIAELTATANTLIASNKELYSEVEELRGLVPEEVKKVEEQRAWKHYDEYRKENRIEGVYFYDPYLYNRWTQDLDEATVGLDNAKKAFKERGELTLGELYSFVGAPKLRGGIANRKAIEDYWYSYEGDNALKLNIRRLTRLREDQTEELWVLEYDHTQFEDPEDEERILETVSDLHDEYKDENDDELMNTLTSAGLA